MIERDNAAAAARFAPRTDFTHAMRATASFPFMVAALMSEGS
jgi:hypothetical protein